MPPGQEGKIELAVEHTEGYAGRFRYFTGVSLGVFNSKLDLSLLTRRHDFVKVAFGAASAWCDVLNLKVGFALILNFEGVP